MQNIDSKKTSKELQRQKRKEEWKKRKNKIASGVNKEDLLAEERAQKALYLLRIDFQSGKDFIEDEDERQNLKAIVIKKCIDDFYFFNKDILGYNLMMENPHQKWCDDHQRTIILNIKRVLRLKPRKSFKTSIYGIGFLLWAWGCISHEIRFFYTSSNKLLLDEVSDGLSQHIGTEKNETFYSYLFGITKDPVAKNTSDVINIQGREGKGFSLILRTAGGSTVGIHPNVIIIDDPCLSGRTKVLTKNGYKSIKNIKEGEYVLTREGYKRVLWSGLTRKKAIVEEFNINGNKIIATPTHNIITANGKKELCFLDRNDKIIKYEDKKWKLEKLEIQKLLNSMELSIEGIRNPKNILIENIFFLVEISLKKLGFFIARFGYFIMGQSLKAIISIIKIITGILMKFGILSAKKAKDIIQNIQKNYLKIQNIEKSKKNILQELESLRSWRVKPQRRKEKEGNQFKLWEKLQKSVNNVGAFLKYVMSKEIKLDFVTKNAKVDGNITIKYILRKENVLSVKKNLKWKNLKKLFAVQENVQQDTDQRRENVYNLHIEDCHEFIANGVLVSNCGEDDRKYESERKNKELWFDTLQPLLVPFYDTKTGIEFETIYYIGTRWHLKDLVNYIEEKLVKEKGQEWDIESESITKDGTPTGEPSYPDFMPAKKIEEFRQSMSEEFFAAQMLNNPIAQGMVVFDLKKLHFIRPDQFEAIRAYGKMITAFDPSLGKSSSDYPMILFGHQHNGVITIFKAIDSKIELAALIPMVAQMNKELGIRTMIYESNNAALIGDNLEKAHKRINHKILLEPIHHGSGANKRERIVSMQPELYSGAVQFMSDYETRYPEFFNQLVFYGAYGADDGPDSCAMLVEYLKEEQFQFTRYEGML